MASFYNALTAGNRQTQLQSAARLAYLGNHAATVIKRSIALFLINNSGSDDPHLPPHALLRTVADLACLPVSAVAQVLQCDPCFGIMSASADSAISGSSLVYLNVDAIITTASKTPVGSMAVLPPSAPSSSNNSNNTARSGSTPKNSNSSSRHRNNQAGKGHVVKGTMPESSSTHNCSSSHMQHPRHHPPAPPPASQLPLPPGPCLAPAATASTPPLQYWPFTAAPASDASWAAGARVQANPSSMMMPVQSQQLWNAVPNNNAVAGHPLMLAAAGCLANPAAFMGIADGNGTTVVPILTQQAAAGMWPPWQAVLGLAGLTADPSAALLHNVPLPPPGSAPYAITSAAAAPPPPPVPPPPAAAPGVAMKPQPSRHFTTTTTPGSNPPTLISSHSRGQDQEHARTCSSRDTDNAAAATSAPPGIMPAAARRAMHPMQQLPQAAAPSAAPAAAAMPDAGLAPQMLLLSTATLADNASAQLAQLQLQHNQQQCASAGSVINTIRSSNRPVACEVPCSANTTTTATGSTLQACRSWSSSSSGSSSGPVQQLPTVGSLTICASDATSAAAAGCMRAAAALPAAAVAADQASWPGQRQVVFTPDACPNSTSSSASSQTPDQDPASLPCLMMILRGKCNKGPDCPYNHSVVVPPAAGVRRPAGVSPTPAAAVLPGFLQATTGETTGAAAAGLGA